MSCEKTNPGIKKGTTPTHIFTTDIDLSDAEVIYITYQQNDETVLELTKDRMTVETDKITVLLTQAETLNFDINKRVYIQIRARFADGSAVASNIMSANALDVLKEGEI